MRLTVDPHGRLPLPAPWADQFAGYDVDAQISDTTDGVQILLTVAENQPQGHSADEPSLHKALAERDAGQVQHLSPADILQGAAGILAARRGTVRAVPTFIEQVLALGDGSKSRAVIDAAIAASSEPAHPAVDLQPTGTPGVFALGIGGRVALFCRDTDRVPIWLTLTTPHAG